MIISTVGSAMTEDVVAQGRRMILKRVVIYFFQKFLDEEMNDDDVDMS